MRNLQILQPSNAKKMAKARCDLRFVARLSCPSFSGATHRVWATQQHNYLMAISMKGNICISYHFHILYIYIYYIICICIYVYVYMYIYIYISYIIKHQQWVHHYHHGPPYQSQSNHPNQGTAARRDFSSSNKRPSMDLLSSSNLTSSHEAGGSNHKRLETPGEHQQLGWTWMFIPPTSPQIWYCYGYNHWM